MLWGAGPEACSSYRSDWFAGFQVPVREPLFQRERKASRQLRDVVAAGSSPAAAPLEVFALPLRQRRADKSMSRFGSADDPTQRHDEIQQRRLINAGASARMKTNRKRMNLETSRPHFILARVRQRGGNWGKAGCAERKTHSRTDSARPFKSNAGSRT